MEMGGKGLSSSESFLGEKKDMWEAMRGPTDWNLPS